MSTNEILAAYEADANRPVEAPKSRSFLDLCGEIFRMSWWLAIFFEIA
jgi:hypothetical protein